MYKINFKNNSYNKTRRGRKDQQPASCRKVELFKSCATLTGLYNKSYINTLFFVNNFSTKKFWSTNNRQTALKIVEFSPSYTSAYLIQKILDREASVN